MIYCRLAGRYMVPYHAIFWGVTPVVGVEVVQEEAQTRLQSAFIK